MTPEEEKVEASVGLATLAAESAVWRLTEGEGEGLDLISASRSARGRLDFVLQAKSPSAPSTLPLTHLHPSSTQRGDVQLQVLPVPNCLLT